MCESLVSDDFYKEIYESCRQICKTNVCGIKILTGDYVIGYEEMAGGFSHYFIEIPPDQRTEITPEKAVLYERAFKRYLPSIIPDLLEKMFPSDSTNRIEAMRKSLRIVEAALGEITYGFQVKPSVKWLQRVVDFYDKLGKLPHERSKAQLWIDGAEMIMWTNISPDNKNNAVSPVIQQAKNNLIEALSVAHNRQALISLLTERLSPDKYQRPSTTKVLSTGSIMNAIKTLGDFKNTIMTRDEASQLPHAIQLSSASTSMSGFKKMLKKNKKNSPSSFAERCGISSFSSLISYLQANPNTKLEIQTTNMVPAYVANTTLDPSYLSVPHMWSFLNHSQPFSFGMKEYEEVCIIVPMYQYIKSHRNILFVLSGDYKNPRGNCCFPEFLSVQHRRTCRDAFERLNKNTSINVPANPAFGVGTSLVNDAGDLYKPIYCRIDGVACVIKTLS